MLWLNENIGILKKTGNKFRQTSQTRFSSQIFSPYSLVSFFRRQWIHNMIFTFKVCVFYSYNSVFYTHSISLKLKTIFRWTKKLLPRYTSVWWPGLANLRMNRNECRYVASVVQFCIYKSDNLCAAVLEVTDLAYEHNSHRQLRIHCIQLVGELDYKTLKTYNMINLLS